MDTRASQAQATDASPTLTRARTFKWRLSIGFLAGLVLLVFVTAIGLNHMATIQNHTDIIVDNHMAKIEAATTMHRLARQRLLILQKIILIEDPFERDEATSLLNQYAADFTRTRQALLAMPLTDTERDLLQRQGRMTGLALPTQRRIVDLMAEDRRREAVELSASTMIPAQDKVLAVLGELYRYEKTAAQTAAEHARQTYIEAQRWLLILSGGAIILGVVIAYSVISYTTRSALERDRHLDKIQEINDALKANTRELIDANNAAQEANRAKSAFLANMSHEIRTPLTAIIGFSEALHGDPGDLEQRRDAIATINRNGKHLLSVINNILDLSKIEAGKLDVEIIPVSLPDLLSDVEAVIAPQAKDKNLQFSIDYRFPLPAQIDSDPTRLKQILINLCNNAVKFTEQGGIHLHVAATPDKQAIVFDVVDSGVGMTAEQLDKVFDAFAQADSTTTRKHGGTGLGLCICKLLTERLGGSIEAVSNPGQGSRFTVQLDIGDSRDRAFIHALPVPSEPRIPPGDDAAGMQPLSGKVLVAEDNPDNQKLIALHLKKAGATATIVENGQLAVDRALGGDFDLVLMDMQMPIMGGLEATVLLRKAGYTKPIVALTANAMTEDVDRCMQAGCSGFLSKPIDHEKFFQTLSDHLATAKPAASPGPRISPDCVESDPEFDKLIINFANSLPMRMAAIDQAHAQGDWAEVASLAHNIKGAGGGFGYRRLSQIADHLQTSARQGDLDQAATSLHELDRHIGQIMRGECASTGLD